MKTLYTAFNGKNNSSKILLDIIKSENKLYLKNSFSTSVKQLENELKKNNYDLIISFGRASLDYDTIKIETTGRGKENIYKTEFDYSNIYEKLKSDYDVLISDDAGNYFCNNIYYNGLKMINDNNLKTNMIFMHIPDIDNITDIYKLANKFE